MLLDVQRLLRSDLMNPNNDPAAVRCALASWAVSWHEVPAASLPNDEKTLAYLLGYGRDVRGFRKARTAGGLRGWVLCSDGRLYHPVVAEKAIEARETRLKQLARTEAARRARHAPAGATPPQAPPTPTASPENRRENPDLTGNVTGDFSGNTPVQTGQVIDFPKVAISVTGSVTTSNVSKVKVSEGKEVSESVRDAPARAPAPTRSNHDTVRPDPYGYRLPLEWTPSQADRVYARDRGLDPDVIAENFRCHWHSKPGGSARKLDWGLVWQRWCRDDAQRLAERGSLGRPPRALRDVKRERDEQVLRAAGLWPPEGSGGPPDIDGSPSAQVGPAFGPTAEALR